MNSLGVKVFKFKRSALALDFKGKPFFGTHCTILCPVCITDKDLCRGESTSKSIE